jgi:hypothetical protein
MPCMQQMNIYQKRISAFYDILIFKKLWLNYPILLNY